MDRLIPKRLPKFKLKQYEPTEAIIKKSICDYLLLLEKRGKLLFIRNNSFAGFVGFNDNKRYINNAKGGSPDLFIFLPKGKVIHIEIKRPSGKQSEEQVKWESVCTKLGHEYYVVRSLNELVKIVNGSP